MSSNIETLNMDIVSLKTVINQIKLQLATDDYTPFVVIGKSGIGKTESMGDLAKSMGIGFKEVRLSHYQESDLIGLPYIENNKTKHAVADLLPDSADEGQGILLLDEITSAPKSMRSAVYQLMDSSRKLGQYELPKRWLVVCCGNGPDDGGDFRGIEPALLSRARCARVEEDIDAWISWAVSREIHPTVIAFLSFMPEVLHDIDTSRPYDMIACPRNWVKLSIQLTNMEKMNGGIITNEQDIEFATCSCVGKRCGPNFVSFYRYNKSVINTDDILAGKVKPEEMANVDTEVAYIVIQNLIKVVANNLKMGKTTNGFSDGAVKTVATVTKWLIAVGRKVKLDLAVMALRDLSSYVPDFKNLILMESFDEICPELLEFSSENAAIYNK